MPKDLTPEQEERLRPLLEERFADDQLFTPLTRADWDRIHQNVHEQVEAAYRQIKEKEMTAWQQFVQDVMLDPVTYTFARLAGEKIRDFGSRTEGVQITYVQHAHIAQGTALCYRVHYRYFLWLSVFSHNGECQGMLSQAARAKKYTAEAGVLYYSAEEAANALIKNAKRLCGLSVS